MFVSMTENDFATLLMMFVFMTLQYLKNSNNNNNNYTLRTNKTGQISRYRMKNDKGVQGQIKHPFDNILRQQNNCIFSQKEEQDVEKNSPAVLTTIESWQRSVTGIKTKQATKGAQ